MQRLGVVVTVLVLLAVLPVVGAQSVPDTDNTVTRIDVGADGDAEWSVIVRTRLASASEVESYRSFQSELRANESSYLTPFRDRITGVVASANDSSPRSMTARNFTIETSIQEVPRRWGVVEYSFEWTGFARTTDSAVVVDEVFDGGFFIAENDTLIISGPSGYEPRQVQPDPASVDNGTVSWQGPRDFAAGTPSIRYVPAGDATPADKTGGVGLEVVGLLGAVVVAVGGYVLFRRREGTAVSDEGAAGIQTDEDRVVELLADNGGQLKQTTVAEELGWSASKTSRTLSSLESDGRIEKLRLGRENVITLPDGDEE